MFQFTRKNLEYLHDVTKEQLRQYTVLEKLALVQDSDGDVYVAVVTEPSKELSIYLYGIAQLNMHEGLHLGDKVPKPVYPFWQNAHGRTLAPVKTVSIKTYMEEYRLYVSEIKQDQNCPLITEWEHVESLPLGLQQDIYDNQKRVSVALDQYVDVIKHRSSYALYVYHNYRGSMCHVEAEMYASIRETIVTELPRMLLGFKLVSHGQRVIKKLGDLKISVSSKSIPVTKKHVAFRFTCQTETQPIHHVSIEWPE